MAAFAEKLADLRQAGAGFEEQKRAMREEFAVDPPGNIYFRHYRTRDGFLSVGCLTPVLNQKLRDSLGVEDPRRAEGFEAGTPQARAALDAFMAEAERIVAGRTTDDWLATLRAVGVPCAIVNFPHEIFDDPQARANGYIEDLVHPIHGAYQTVSSPLKMDATPLRHHGPSPAMGAHTDEVLRELGFDEGTVESLRKAAVVGRYDEQRNAC
jgi:formyl-CoA transferase